VRPPRIFRTSSFRLTLLYAAFFSASVLVLLGVIYWATSFYMKAQLDAAIDGQLTELQEALQSGGSEAVAQLIGELVSDAPEGPSVYLLQDRNGTVRAGNLPSLPPTPGIVEVELPEPVASAPQLRAIYGRGILLPGGDYMLVGADAYPLNEMHEVILRAFGWSLVVTLLLATMGGALMSGSLLRRVEGISRTAREIMEGNLSRRIAMRGVDDEFDHLAASLNAMLERTQASVEGMRQVSNDIAHDLRTPLTRLRHRLELARRQSQSADALRSAIDRSIADTDAILDTFGALLRIAEIESGTRKGGFAALDLSELLRTVIEVYQPMAEEKGQHVTADIAANLRILGDRELLTQLFANLVENAMRHSPAGARVTLIAARAGGAVDVVVADDGPGIPTEERDKVVRRFYRLEASRTTPGSGLGLSLAAAIASLHDVPLQLDDNQPGLRVQIRFPEAAAPHE
jgi:signal transduction histidine kinase